MSNIEGLHSVGANNYAVCVARESGGRQDTSTVPGKSGGAFVERLRAEDATCKKS
jgi:hypothetical protein